MSETVNIEGLDKVEVLAALYNASKPQGMGFMSFNPKPMTREEAAKLLEREAYFDYVQGRVMKINLSQEEVNVRAYDRDNGAGTAAKVIDTLRTSGNVNNDAIQATHTQGIHNAAEAAREMMDRETTFARVDGVVEIGLGLSEMKSVLKPAIERALNQ